MKLTRISILLFAMLVLGVGLAVRAGNQRAVHELRTQPDGERAQKVMLLTLPSGKTLPVNYLRDGATVYAAADFPWWREIEDSDHRASVLIRGKRLEGRIRVVLDDEALRNSVFDRLRPTAPRFAGTLVVVDLAPEPNPRFNPDASRQR